MAFDRGQQALFLGNRWMAVAPIAARILMTLLDHPGTIVPASTLIQAGWQGEPRGPADLSKQIRTRRVFRKPVPTSRAIWSRRGLAYLLQDVSETTAREKSIKS